MKRLFYLPIALLMVCTCVMAQEELTVQQEIQGLIDARQKLITSHRNRSEQLAEAARSLEDETIVYDPAYVRIGYPNGDVPAKTGVCSDVVIRAFRKAWDWDLQKTIYDYRKYNDQPTDRNIDHRRVRNLMTFFDEYFDNQQLYNQKPNEYRKGNIIIWDLGGGQLHIAICVEQDTIIHNICCGQVIEPISNVYGKIIRNYSFYPDFSEKILNKYKQQLNEINNGKK